MQIKERPILFQGEMVRALLDGTKTQTRRVVKLPVEQDAGWAGGWKIVHKAVTLAVETYNRMIGKAAGKDPTICPYGQPGDRLWVRETWQALHKYNRAKADDIPIDDRHWINYPASGNEWDARQRPSIFMPRWASRILLEVVSVRVERLNAISEADAWADGIEACDGLLDDMKIIELAKRMGRQMEDAAPIYAALWELINGAGSWDANPWVWVVEFKRVTPCP